MAVLNDRMIRTWLESGTIVARPEIPLPVDVDPIRPASLDLRLGSTFLAPTGIPGTFMTRTLTGTQEYVLAPEAWILAATDEWVELPDNLLGILSGKSSLARQGILVETAGVVDPGWKGNLTLEIKNLSPWVLFLKPGMFIAQLRFHMMNESAQQPYGERADSHYQNSHGPYPSWQTEDGTPIQISFRWEKLKEKDRSEYDPFRDYEPDNTNR